VGLTPASTAAAILRRNCETFSSASVRFPAGSNALSGPPPVPMGNLAAGVAICVMAIVAAMLASPWPPMTVLDYLWSALMDRPGLRSSFE
jgi:hypothetical protein